MVPSDNSYSVAGLVLGRSAFNSGIGVASGICPVPRPVPCEAVDLLVEQVGCDANRIRGVAHRYDEAHATVRGLQGGIEKNRAVVSEYRPCAGVEHRVVLKQDARLDGCLDGRAASLEDLGCTLHRGFDVVLPVWARSGATVGIITRDTTGSLACATSTGGTSYRPAGRVGDVPLPGSGFWAQGDLAVAATGVGEAITKSLLSYRVYERIRSTGDSLDAAMRWGIDELIDEGISVGLISLGSEGEGRGHSNTDMPWAAWTG